MIIWNCKLIRHHENLESQRSLLRLAIPEFGLYVEFQRSDFFLISFEKIRHFQFCAFNSSISCGACKKLLTQMLYRRFSLSQLSFAARGIRILLVRVCDFFVLQEEFSYGILLQKA